MDELDKNIPDDFWRKAFDEAAETPPLRVWNSIERRLDQTNDTKIIPLWGLGLISSRPIAWGMGIAAAVTLLLIGWWAGSTQTAQDQHRGIAQHVESPERTTAKSSTPVDADADIATSQAHSSPAIASATKPALPSAKPEVSSDYSLSTPSVNGQTGDLPVHLRIVANRRANKTTGRLTAISARRSSMAPGAQNESLPSAASRISMSSSAFADAHSVSANVISPASADLVAIEQLYGKSWRFRDLAQIHRIVWFRPTELPLEPESLKSKQKTRDVWASASVMPGSFNPMVAVQTTSVSSANYATSMDALKTAQSNSSVSSRPNFSVAYQAGAGMQLSERWSLESGIGYLSGRSTVETPGQIPTASLVGLASKSTTSGTLYVDALKSSIHSGDLMAAPQASYNNISNSAYQQTYTSTRQVFSNDYQYMQIPLQVGYQLRPRKRLSLAVLGGLITNIFVRNTVGNELVITAKDGVYRPLSLAATMGARFRYRPTKQWSASLAGVYQPSLGLGTRTDSQVQSHPTSAGMSFGVDYHF